jgi:type VI secretion system protein ImpG
VQSSDGTASYTPLYSTRHAGPPDRVSGHYVSHRRTTTVKDRQRSEVFLSFVDLALRKELPAVTRVLVSTLCTNGNLPSKTEGRPDFTLDSGEAAAVSAVLALVPPTPTHQAGLLRETAWRLVSHLSLNYLSIGDESADGRPGDAVAALREILLLHASHTTAQQGDWLIQQIQGITDVRTQRIAACPASLSSPVRGLQVRLTINPQSYRGASYLLLASVLERFFGRYASINSFTQLVLVDSQGEELKRWPPRAGDQLLL